MRLVYRRLFAAVFTLGILLLTTALLPVRAQSDADARRQVIVDIIEKAFNQGDLSLIEQGFADDFVSHPGNGTREAFVAQLNISRAAIPDYHSEIDHLLVDGDYVAFHFAEQGTFENAMEYPGFSIPPTLKPLANEGFVVLRFGADDKVVEEWDGFDLLPYLVQLGLLPPMSDMSATPEAGAAMVATPVPMPTGEAMTTGQEAAHKATAKAFFDAVYNDRKPELIDNFVAPGYQLTDPTGTYDLAGFKAYSAVFPQGIPDLKLTIHAQVAEGDWVAMAYGLAGTFTGALPSADGTVLQGQGQKIDLTGVSYFHFDADGKIDGEWDKYDQITLLEQLATIPPADGEATAEATAASGG